MSAINQTRNELFIDIISFNVLLTMSSITSDRRRWGGRESPQGIITITRKQRLKEAGRQGDGQGQLVSRRYADAGGPVITA